MQQDETALYFFFFFVAFFFDFFVLFFVDILKGTYKGQNAIRLVRTKITAMIPRMMAAVPDIVPVR